MHVIGGFSPKQKQFLGGKIGNTGNMKGEIERLGLGLGLGLGWYGIKCAARSEAKGCVCERALLASGKFLRVVVCESNHRLLFTTSFV